MYPRSFCVRAERKRLPLTSDIQFVRPFLSSTFRDFNDERNISFKTTFPQVCALVARFFAHCTRLSVALVVFAFVF